MGFFLTWITVPLIDAHSSHPQLCIAGPTLCDLCVSQTLVCKFREHNCVLVCVLLLLCKIFVFTGISRWQASSIGNGYCNQVNNKPECSYDGGDCCECTCQVSGFGDDYSAGCVEFACIDPEAPCVDDDSVTVRMVEIDFMEECGYVSRSTLKDLFAVEDSSCSP